MCQCAPTYVLGVTAVADSIVAPIGVPCEITGIPSATSTYLPRLIVRLSVIISTGSISKQIYPFSGILAVGRIVVGNIVILVFSKLPFRGRCATKILQVAL